MKSNNLLMLAVALSTTLLVTACDRDREPATDIGADVAAPMPTDTPEPVTPPVMTDDRPFAEMDANGDGGITMDELTAEDMLHEHFGPADSNGDGALSQEEVEQHQADMAASGA